MPESFPYGRTAFLIFVSCISAWCSTWILQISKIGAEKTHVAAFVNYASLLPHACWRHFHMITPMIMNRITLFIEWKQDHYRLTAVIFKQTVDKNIFFNQPLSVSPCIVLLLIVKWSWNCVVMVTLTETTWSWWLLSSVGFEFGVCSFFLWSWIPSFKMIQNRWFWQKVSYGFLSCSQQFIWGLLRGMSLLIMLLVPLLVPT